MDINTAWLLSNKATQLWFNRFGIVGTICKLAVILINVTLDMTKIEKLKNLMCGIGFCILLIQCSDKKSNPPITSDLIYSKYKIEDFDTPDRKKEINELINSTESHEMNPSLKKIESEFAIDTFKIGYFQRKFPVNKVDLETSLNVQKSTCVMYDRLNSKYFHKLEKILKHKDYDDLIKSQEIWEKYKANELNIFQRKINERLDFEFNFYKEYTRILKSRLETLYFYYYRFADVKS